MIDRGMLYTYMNSYHTPERTVLTGVGVEHDELVKLGETLFVNKPPIWKEHKNILDLTREKDLSICQYTGGYLPVRRHICGAAAPPTPSLLMNCIAGLVNKSSIDSWSLGWLQNEYRTSRIRCCEWRGTVDVIMHSTPDGGGAWSESSNEQLRLLTSWCRAFQCRCKLWRHPPV